jgi:ankyrin repeat protein
MQRDVFMRRAGHLINLVFRPNLKDTPYYKQIALFESIIDNNRERFGMLIDSGNGILNGRLTNIGKHRLPWILHAHPPWICVCAFFGSVLCVRELVFRSAKLTVSDKLKRSLPSFACAGGSFEVIDELVNLGVEFDKRDQNSFWPAEYAAAWGRRDVLLWLWMRGALNQEKKIGFEGPPFESGWTEPEIVSFAALNGHTEVVKFLVDGGEAGFPLNKAGPHVLPSFGSAVHASCQGGHAETLAVLAGLGADLEKMNDEKKTPLSLAACSGSLTCVRQLHKCGVRASLSGSEKLEVVEAAGFGHIDIVRELINVFDVDHDAKDRDGICALVKALENHQILCVHWLVENFGWPMGCDTSLGAALGRAHELKMAIGRLKSSDFTLEGKLALAEAAVCSNWQEAFASEPFRCVMPWPFSLDKALKEADVPFLEWLLSSGWFNLNETRRGHRHPLLLALSGPRCDAVDRSRQKHVVQALVMGGARLPKDAKEDLVSWVEFLVGLGDQEPDLEEINLKGVRRIPSQAFSLHGNLRRICLAPGLLSIGDGAFENCGSLVSVVIPDGLTVIPRDPFSVVCPSQM